MQHLEVSCAVWRFFKSLGFKGISHCYLDALFSVCSLFTGRFEYKEAVNLSCVQNNENDENLVYMLLLMSANAEGREMRFPFRLKPNLLQMILSLISPSVIQSPPFEQIISHVTNSCSASSFVTPCALLLRWYLLLYPAVRMQKTSKPNDSRQHNYLC